MSLILAEAANAGFLSTPTIISIVTAILVAIAEFWFKSRYNALFKKSEQNKQLLEEHARLQEDQRIERIVQQTLQSTFSDTNKEIQQLKEELTIVKNQLEITKIAIQSQLRHDIRNTCRRCLRQGWRTVEDDAEVVAMHQNYEKLNVNGVTNQLYEDFLKLPFKTESVLLNSQDNKERK